MYLFSMADVPLPPPRPAFTAYSLPLPRRREGPAAALSFLAHLTIAVLVLWRGAAMFAGGGGGGSGPRGGGGGGGRPAVTWFALPAPTAAQAQEVPPAPLAVTVPTIAIPAPEPVKLDMPTPAVSVAAPAAAVGTGAGTTGGPGQGPGTGGGQGTGTGPGIGSDSGAGSGGDARYISPASPKWMVTPPIPPSEERRPHEVRFWVTAEGRVTRIEVSPPIKNTDYRREFMDAMKKFQFNPARTRDGNQVESIAIVIIKSS
ncbi:MAG TPA: energy transducer TonB [Gemmatimonadales bacterium]|nr:energy transducer TonB [Gemmatimonadales bacterium]